MEYVKGKPYFCDTERKIKQYPYLKQDIDCEVLIIGGGIDGAILNFYLSKKHDVVLVDKGRLGYACTSCATALLEYQLDEYASDLMDYMTEEEIVLAYNMGLESIKRIKRFIKEYGNECHFHLRPTFLYTDKKSNVADLEEEYAFRHKHGFECKLITEGNNPFPFPVECGIYCANGGAEFNPYLFAKQMIENASNQNKIYENTHITKLEKIADGYIATTTFGEKITCKKVVISTGFNWEILGVSDLCERFISYSIVTEPVKDFTWYNSALIHDTISPYHYLRLLPDNRIIFGGEDTPFKEKPIDEKKTNKIYDSLTNDLFTLFPNLKGNVKIDYKFCGAFGTTPNNMGLIGKSTFDDNLFLFISCGANGIINAMSGVDVIEDAINNKPNELASIFAPRRSE